MMKQKAAFALFFVLLVILGANRSVLSQDRITDLDPTVVLISIDGFRWDYPEKFGPPTIDRLIANGTRAKYLRPAFPTKTFPNHYTQVTGLYPGTHGIIENNMFDPDTGRVFGLGKANEVTDPMWWGGEPIWNTVQKQGKIAASFFWPGSEALIGGMQPRYTKTYVHETPHEERVDTVLGWLDLPKNERPVLITLYFSDVDDAGHRSGPDSPETRAAVMKVDAAIARLVDGLDRRGIGGSVNLLLVSDHGMSPYRRRDGIILDEMFDPSDAERVFWVGEFTQIFPKPGKEAAIYDSIKARLPKTARIYRRGSFPARWRLNASTRIAPLVVVPKEGTYITNRERMSEHRTDEALDRIRGGHGYDNRGRNMRAFFLGYGPRFEKGRRSGVLEAVDIYNVISRILEVRPAANEGSHKRVNRSLR